MKAYTRTYAQYKYAVELDDNVIIPSVIRTWLLLKDSPFDESHIAYMANGKNIIAFEYSSDAYYFIAWMEILEVDYLPF